MVPKNVVEMQAVQSIRQHYSKMPVCMAINHFCSRRRFLSIKDTIYYLRLVFLLTERQAQSFLLRHVFSVN